MNHVLTVEQAIDLASRALVASGAKQEVAGSVARAVVDAHARGRTNVGFEHLPYYCNALRRGAINGIAEPTVVPVKPGWMHADAHSGFTHHAFDCALDEFTSMAQHQGVAVLTIRNTYTCGELGYFPIRLARRGFAAIAVTNAGPAAVAPSGAGHPVFSTNPIAYAFPRDGSPPLVVDQSSSACTLVDVRAAKERGEPIPGDWALDRDGRLTKDPGEALQGTFKPFGGYKGSNIALLVELLAAGLGGANWSIDAPSFAEGTDCPDVGQWMMAMDIGSADDRGSGKRINAYLERIAELGAHIPGKARRTESGKPGNDGIILAAGLYDKIQSLI